MVEPLLLSCLDGIAYMVDPAGRVVSYGQQRWNAFAEANDAPELCAPENIIGLDLLRVVKGDEVRDAYRSLMDELLDGKRPGAAFGFRCDAPHVRREMRMAITPVNMRGEVTGLLFQSIVLRTAARPPLGIFQFRDLAAVLGHTADRPIVTLCSWCQEVKAPNDIDPDTQWISAEEYYRRGGNSDVLISHGICAACEAELLGG